MAAAPTPVHNVKQVVPFLWVNNMDLSLRFYTEGLGFTLKNKWVVGDKIRWCWLELGGAALMLQEYLRSQIPNEKLGQGVSLCFLCEDAIALYQEFKSHNLEASEPFVGNSLWVTSLHDPDGYRIDFESPTNVPEETQLSALPA